MTGSGRGTAVAIAGLVLLGLVAGAGVVAYKQRVAPPYPAVAGEPYAIAIGANGCPVIPKQVWFVDSPGDLVPPDPVEAVLCTVPTELFGPPSPSDSPSPSATAFTSGAPLPSIAPFPFPSPFPSAAPFPSGAAVPPLQRVLRTGAADFAAMLNRLPDRNAAWRDWQRKHSGLWPDAPPSTQDVCLMMGQPYQLSYVLRFADRPPVALIQVCGTGGLTSGRRTRSDVTRPHVLDQFLERFAAQR